MLFTIMEILGYLVVTALLSGYLGWLIHEKVVIKDVQKRVSTEVNNLRSRCSKLMDEVDTVRGELAASEQARAELEANVPALTSAPAEAIEVQAETSPETDARAPEVAPEGRAEGTATEEAGPPEPAPPEVVTEPAPAEATPPAAAPSPPEEPTRAAQPDDDLKVIKGIGPVLERKLKGLGITSYGQMAALTPEEIARLGRTLGIGDRINRDNWVGRARDAHVKAYGAEP